MERDFPWDALHPELLRLSREVWTVPHARVSLRQQSADLFFVRSSRRDLGLSLLFQEGLYVEAASLVRNAFEDWIEYAYILSPWSDEGWADFRKTVLRTDARVFEGFRELCGAEAANEHFPGMPEGVAAYVDARRERPLKLADKAREVGLGGVYGVAYPYLSAYSHSTMRPFRDMFSTAGSKTTARIPERDFDEERTLALWAFWFELRVLTLAAGAYGVDWEIEADKWLQLRGDSPGFDRCILVRERLFQYEA